MLVVLVVSACVEPSLRPEVLPPVELQWPSAPAEAKIRWVKTISNVEDAGIAKGFWTSFVELFSGTDPFLIVRPYGVLSDNQGRLFIADPGAGEVHFLNPAEQSYVSIRGHDSALLQSPIGLATDDNGHIYITDSVARVVYQYDIASSQLKTFLDQGLHRPTGVAWSAVTQLLYIVDTVANRIVAVDQQGNEKLVIEGSIKTGWGFHFPTDIWISRKGEIHVTDSLNFNIKIFSSDGQLLEQFGVAGDAPGEMHKPKGVATDSQGNVYVCDAMNDMVQVYDRTGQPLLAFGGQGVGPGEFWLPSGLSVDMKDNIYVADTYNRRIQVFRHIFETKIQNAADRSVETSVSGARE